MHQETLLPVLTLLGLGFVIGLKHAFDPDHIIAISTLVSRTKNLKKTMILGAFWGFGHSAMLLLAGSLILISKISIPQELNLIFESLVGVMLILLGLDLILRIFKKKIHLHSHRHGKTLHAHFHSHEKQLSHRHEHRSFFVGLVHGLAGSSPVILLALPLANSIFQGVFYILSFGLGSILGMIFIAPLITIPFLMAGHFKTLFTFMILGIGSLSIIFGFSMMIRIFNF